MDITPLIKNLLKTRLDNQEDLAKFKRKTAKQSGLSVISNNTILRAYRQFIKSQGLPAKPKLLELLRLRKIRTLSGVAVVTVLTKPYHCPGKCIYCPSEAHMPKSYLSSEPAAQRAVLNKFDPRRQTKTRLDALKINGHPIDKIELIILGGTWSAYPRAYQKQFVKRCFDAANGRASKSLLAAQKLNEKTNNRIIGLTVETRPDEITPREIKWMRELGVTRVQIGVQTIDDKILKIIKRGHDTKTVIQATKLLKDAGLKINYHLMPGLPNSTPLKDRQVFYSVFNDPKFKPDFIKLYPTLVLKNSILYKWWKQGKYKPYSAKQLMGLIPKLKKIVPRWVRIERLIRDIPGPDIKAGSKLTNLRQVLQEQGVKCKCIRCREARNSKVKLSQTKLFVEKYNASGGTEYFISFEDKKHEKLYAFIRLRLPLNSSPEIIKFFPILKDSALIRELHTYGQLIGLKKKVSRAGVQHLGFGKRLMKEAERIARENGYKKIAVISGIGVREYYRKLGYKLQDTYMIKDI
ncbi:tRNA uridine(34) 5-carboxymethylaminomethyl modification radical SAM/GNAT enzyme Elp3 [Patescibacteria group bacterium]|nr:tRNA uridine(34) 5-carboxymethylaminomethyl modification radical SAM/GNAT enzyme Elp3 [Patescibacteria group bacterium]MBU1890228.1 tRNA uridine(34) 5-carboxymethylaminomethyl modification radical SAM/GNAT enzyme Elp3 [Patescibacteria group bacterium]